MSAPPSIALSRVGSGQTKQSHTNIYLCDEVSNLLTPPWDPSYYSAPINSLSIFYIYYHGELKITPIAPCDPSSTTYSTKPSFEVENHIVGAPCGVMDQMTSSCGEANKLLAMICQPAEVIGLVDIPNHVRFWGIDSGIRHSVGGADYGSVRVSAYMRRKMIKSMASSIPSQYEARYADKLPDFLLGQRHSLMNTWITTIRSQ
ncbi:hypothetical protein F2Q69_00040429 [Brassica cretica]|uniref:Uncharacterized protein n=1 Tax=Brassica cretica TaxID=69181 RepID=A0A8S9NR17_BRACR|nr:hypothetical protein F2Q69_00040429 [Brassica cretica]